MKELSKIFIEPERVFDSLKRNIQIKEVYQKILYQQIIEKAAQARDLVITQEEIQIECDRLRRNKRLEKAADTLAWLAEQMITVEDLEAGIRNRLLEQKLAKFLFAKEIEKFFSQNSIDFEQILLYQIVVPYEKVAQEIFYQIDEKEISFYEAAHLYDIDEQRQQKCGFEGKIYRWHLKPDVAAVVFSAQPGKVIGPLKIDQGYHLLMVEQFIPAELTNEKYQEILDGMFKQWLASELNYMLHNQAA